jgi:hypothetical protein
MNDGWVEAEFEAILREHYVRVIGQVLARLSQNWACFLRDRAVNIDPDALL